MNCKHTWAFYFACHMWCYKYIYDFTREFCLYLLAQAFFLYPSLSLENLWFIKVFHCGASRAAAKLERRLPKSNHLIRLVSITIRICHLFDDSRLELATVHRYAPFCMWDERGAWRIPEAWALQNGTDTPKRRITLFATGRLLEWFTIPPISPAAWGLLTCSCKWSSLLLLLLLLRITIIRIFHIHPYPRAYFSHAHQH